jgi:RimJ/RimL family protein N-acetyltransferase
MSLSSQRTASVHLEPWGPNDLPLLERLLGDPEMTAHLGEMGWSVLPAFQGRGIAAAGTTLAIAVARSEQTRRFLHAFPSVDNAPSNAICWKVGFELVAACDFEYPPGHVLRCNDWRLDLTGHTLVAW